MKNQTKKMIFAGISGTLGAVLLLVGIVLSILAFTPAKIFGSFEGIVYIIAVILALALAGIIVSFVFVVLNAKARQAEEDQLLSGISATDKGEKLLLSENGIYYSKMAKAFNRSSLLREYVRLPYGVYKESKFDNLVLDTLENEVTARAGLVYFVLVADKPIKTKGPRDALLSMVQGHFGEKNYYCLVHNGVAVFSPVLPSKEEFLGKVRRTVQLYSYTEDTTHISCKSGVSFYPDSAPRLMTSDALRASLDGLSLSVKEVETVVPHLGFNAAENEAFLLHKTAFLEDASKAQSVEELDNRFREFSERSMPYLTADSMGVMVYREDMRQYEILMEIAGQEGASFSLLAKEGKLDEEIIAPFYEWSKKERGHVFVNDGVYLSDDMSARLDSLGVASFACYGVGMGDSPLALIYITGKEKYRFDNNKVALEYLDIAREYVMARKLLQRQDQAESHEDIILSAFDHFAYGVSKDSYNLSHVSPNLAKAIPDAKVGRVCYEALFGLKAPCEHCPLIQSDVEKMIPRLASGVFAYKTVQGDGETLLILSPHKADFSPSRIDPYTGLLSDKSLHEDLQSEILLKDSKGVILAFRIRNVDAIARLVRLDGYEEVVKAVSDSLGSAGLARGLYRNGIAGFAYLLPYASGEDAYALADKVRRKFVEKVTFHEREIEFIFDYVVISYPLEAETPFALDAILRILYQRADASSRGRLFEINNEKGRLVDLDYYMKTKLEEGLRAKRLPVAYTHYDELAGKRTAFLEASLMLEDEAGAMIDPKIVQEAADALSRGKEVHLAMISSVARYLGEKRKEIASSALRGVIVKIDASCFSESFLDSVLQTMEINKAFKKHLYLEVAEENAKTSVYTDFKRLARNKGINVGLANYKGDLDSATLSDYAYVSFPAKSIYGAGKKDFLVSLSNVRRASINVLIDGYRDNEEKRYLGSLTFHYGRKAGEPPVKESDVTF